MAQAKRRKRGGASADREPMLHGLGIFFVGMVMGWLVTLLWQGMQATDGGIGSGLRDMFEQSREQEQAQGDPPPVQVRDAPVEEQPRLEFYTVLPGIEIVVDEPPEPEPADEAGAPTVQAQPATTGAADNTAATGASAPAVSNAAPYMLQAGSYRRAVDADRLKAELALSGLPSIIQKVTIQGQGDFYRVRLGPYLTYEDMVRVDEQLSARGIKPLRLKVSRGG